VKIAFSPVRRQAIQSGDRIRVLVVDDSVVVRSLILRALEVDPAVEVVGAAAHGRIALAKIPHLNPDVITLDVEMPQMDGLETLRHIRQLYPGIYVIMFSSLTEKGAATTLDALTLGANDYVAKPVGESGVEGAISILRSELLPKIKQFFLCGSPTPAVAPRIPPEVAVRPPAPAGPRPPRRLLAIGVSTGGPTALSVLIPMLPADFPAPVLIVQHMPPVFTRLLAERLQKQSRLRIEEAEPGALVEPGKILIAPGDFHMYVEKQGSLFRIVLDQSTPLNSCRPSVDALFNSVATAYGAAAVGVILTGMGQDGMRGAERLKHAGGYVIAQDEASSVVWGMPGFVARAGIADAVVPLTDVVPQILKQTGQAAAGLLARARA
jgi:two-component system chemotaxis response regulator CheB